METKPPCRVSACLYALSDSGSTKIYQAVYRGATHKKSMLRKRYTSSESTGTKGYYPYSSSQVALPKGRRPYHPPLLSPYLPPTGTYAQYLIGQTGPQGFGKRDFYVGQIPCRDARAIIIAHHYSHTIVNNSYLHLGIFREGALEGVLQFGYMLNPACAGKVVKGTAQGQYMELNRMWLSEDAPRNSESRAISYTIKYIRRACHSVAWIQSFADERCGRLGVVYQACSFLYVGSHTTVFYELDNQFYHEMLLTAHRKSGQRGEYLRANLPRATMHNLRQFRYVRFLKMDWQRRLRLPVHPYPKRNL